MNLSRRGYHRCYLAIVGVDYLIVGAAGIVFLAADAAIPASIAWTAIPQLALAPFLLWAWASRRVASHPLVWGTLVWLQLLRAIAYSHALLDGATFAEANITILSAAWAAIHLLVARWPEPSVQESVGATIGRGDE